MALFGGLNPIFQVIVDEGQQSLLDAIKENIKLKSTHHVTLDEPITDGNKETFYDFEMVWENTHGTWSSGGFVPDSALSSGKMTLYNPTSKVLTVSLAEVNLTNTGSGEYYILSYDNDKLRIKVNLDNSTLTWEYLQFSGTLDISNYVDSVFWISLDTSDSYPVLSVYNSKNGEIKDDFKDYNETSLLELKTILNSSISIDNQDKHRFEHILFYGERFSPTPELIHEREGFPIDNMYIRPDGSLFYKVPMASGTQIDLHTSPPEWNPYIDGTIPWVPINGDINPSTTFTKNDEPIASTLSSGAVVISDYVLSEGQQWVMFNGINTLTKTTESALWGLAMGLVPVSEARYEEGVYYEEEPLYGNNFSLPYYSYMMFDNNGNPYSTISERLVAYDENKTLIDTVDNVVDISHVMYTWYPDDHFSSGIYLDIHMSDGTIHSNYLGSGVTGEKYAIAMENMWDRTGLPSDQLHISLNTIVSDTPISSGDQTGVNNNIHIVDISKQYVTDEVNPIINNNTIVTNIKEPYNTHINDLSTYNPINDRIYLSSGFYKFSLDNFYKLEEHSNVQVIRGKDTLSSGADYYSGIVYVHVKDDFSSLYIHEEYNTYPDRFVYDDTAPEPFKHTNILQIPSTEPLVINPGEEYIIYIEGSGIDISQPLIDIIGSGNQQYITDENGDPISSGSSSGNYVIVNIGSGVGSGGSGITIVGIEDPFTGITGIHEGDENPNPIVLPPETGDPLPSPFIWDNTEPYEYNSSGSGSGLNVGSGGEVVIKNPQNELIYGWLIEATIDIHGTPTVTEPFAEFGNDFKLHIEPEWNLIWEYKTHTGKINITDIVLEGPYKVLVNIENDYPIITVFNENTNVVADLSTYGNEILKEIKENGDLSKDFKIPEHTDENYDIYYHNFVLFKPPTVPSIDEIINTTYEPQSSGSGSGSGSGTEPEEITSASLTALGHSNFDYHNYQILSSNYTNFTYPTYVFIRLQYNYYFVDANGVPTEDENATKVYYTGMYQLEPGSYDQHQHTMIDKNDTSIRTIKLPENIHEIRVFIVNGDGAVYRNGDSINVPNDGIAHIPNLNNGDYIRIDYSHSENGNVVVSDTVQFRLIKTGYEKYIPRDFIQTNYNGMAIARSTQPIWYVRDNTIIIHLEKLVGHTYIFNNPDSYTGYVPVFPHNYRPYNNGYFPEIAIPYVSGMKVKWLGLTSVITPNSTTPSQLSIIRAQYNEETTGWGGIVYPAGWGHSSTYMSADHEYDIVDGDPDTTDPEYVGTYLKMEQNLDALYKTAINVYFHKI